MKHSTNLITFSKRKFLKSCVLGIGGILCDSNRLNAFTGKSQFINPSVIPSEELWKWSKEALFYEKTPQGLHCKKCPNECLLESGQLSWCRNRINYKGKMYTIAYGNPCAVHIDPIEKKPFYHFLPTARAFSIAAAGCNLRCLNCQNWEISQVSPKETENYDLMPERVVEECLNYKCESIAYTYSEPTSFYEYAYDTARLASQKGIKNLWKSNGYINEEPLLMLCKVLDAANIDLKSFDDSIYRKLNAGTLAPVLNTLKTFHKAGVWLEITNLVIPQWSDNLEIIDRMCKWIVDNGLNNCPVHFTRFTPLYKLNQLPVTPVSILEQAREIAVKNGVRYAYVGNVPGHKWENTYCHKCGKMIIERRGFTITQNKILKGKCTFCNERIPGVWS